MISTKHLPVSYLYQIILARLRYPLDERGLFCRLFQLLLDASVHLHLSLVCVIVARVLHVELVHLHVNGAVAGSLTRVRDVWRAALALSNRVWFLGPFILKLKLQTIILSSCLLLYFRRFVFYLQVFQLKQMPSSILSLSSCV